MSLLGSLQLDSALSYLIAFLVPALDAIFPALPGESAVIAVGVATAGSADPRIALLVGCAAAGAFAGDNLSYLLGRSGGRPLVLRAGRYVRLTESRLGRLEALFHRHGHAVVVLARFVDGLRQVNGVTVGLVRMPFARFLRWDAPATIA